MDGFKELTVCNVLPGFYFINDRGEIISKKSWKRLKLTADKDGYYCVSLCTKEKVSAKEHKRKKYRVAALVLREFGGDPPETMLDPTVDHRDGNKTNNSITNLRWLERGVYSAIRKNRGVGESNPAAKLSMVDVSEIKWLLANCDYSLSVIGRMYGVHKSTINNINRGKNWKNVTAIMPSETKCYIKSYRLGKEQG